VKEEGCEYKRVFSVLKISLLRLDQKVMDEKNFII
jgi:hypothetical protein